MTYQKGRGALRDHSSDVGILDSAMSRAVFLRRGVGSAVALSGTATLLEACGSGSAAKVSTTDARPPARPTGSLVLGVGAKAASLDPARALGTEAYTINQNAYDGLTLWHEDPTRLAPALATSWTTNENATEWTFKLRPGVTFHDGEPLTSEAVRRSFDHHRNGTGSFVAAYAGDYDTIDDSDPQTVVVRYKQPFPDLARNAPILGIISPKALAGTPDQVSGRLERASAGAGAFRFDAPFHGNGFKLAAFDDYWGDGPYLKQIELRVVPEESARVAALQAGDVDFLLQVSPLPFTSLRHDPRFTASTTVTWLQSRLIFACDRAPFTDARARQAVAHCIDPQLLIDKLLQGQGEVAHGLMPSGCYGYTVPPTQYGQDVEKAKELWDAAGGGSHTITVAYFSGLGQAEARKAEAIAAQIRSAGLAAEVVGIDDTQAGDELHGPHRKYDVLSASFGWVNGGPFFYTPGIFADTQSARYTGHDVLDLQEKQNATADGPHRLALLRQLQAVAQEQLFVYAYAEVTNSDVFDRDIHGYATARNGFMYRFSGAYRA